MTHGVNDKFGAFEGLKDQAIDDHDDKVKLWKINSSLSCES